jgi:hypothetical protein
VDAGAAGPSAHSGDDAELGDDYLSFLDAFTPALGGVDEHDALPRADDGGEDILDDFDSRPFAEDDVDHIIASMVGMKM